MQLEVSLVAFYEAPVAYDRCRGRMLPVVPALNNGLRPKDPIRGCKVMAGAGLRLPAAAHGLSPMPSSNDESPTLPKLVSPAPAPAPADAPASFTSTARKVVESLEGASLLLGPPGQGDSSMSEEGSSSSLIDWRVGMPPPYREPPWLDDCALPSP